MAIEYTIEWCPDCDQVIEEPLKTSNGGSYCPQCGHNTDSQLIVREDGRTDEHTR